MTPCKRQPRLVDSTTIERFEMKGLEYSLREGLKAALFLARFGYVKPLGRLIAASAGAISLGEKVANLRAEILQHKLDVLKDKYEPKE